MTDWNRGMYAGEAQADAVPPLTVVPHEPVSRRRSQDRKGWEVFHDGRWLPEHEARAAGAYDRPIPTHTPSVVMRRQAPKEEEPMTTATCAQCGATFTYEREPGRAGRVPVTCSPECHRERTRATKQASAQRRRHAASASEVPTSADPADAEHEPGPDDAVAMAPQSSDQQVLTAWSTYRCYAHGPFQSIEEHDRIHGPFPCTVEPVTDDDRNDPVEYSSAKAVANTAGVVTVQTPTILTAGIPFDEPEPGLHVTLAGPMYAAIEVVLEQAQADYEQAARDAAAAIEARNVAQVAVSYLRAKLASLEEADAA